MDKALGPLPSRGPAREELSPARRAVLDTLIEIGGRRTVAELAGRLGQHPNTVREHLEALADAGLVSRTLRHSTGRGRPAALYRATLAATPAGPEYALLAEVLVSYLARALPPPLVERHALAAGRDWGRAMRERHLVDESPDAEEDWTGAVGRLAELFERAGFEPTVESEADGSRLQRLRRCPVLALAREHPGIVCTGHLGMAQEILGHDGVEAERVSLEAFAEDGACLLRVTPPTERPSDG